MWQWAVVIAGLGATTYVAYLIFLLIVLVKHGPETVEKIAKVIPAPRSIESVITSLMAAIKLAPTASPHNSNTTKI
jgi:ABC-type sulfate transport system permease component